jgi:hypothetical protein
MAGHDLVLLLGLASLTTVTQVSRAQLTYFVWLIVRILCIVFNHFHCRKLVGDIYVHALLNIMTPSLPSPPALVLTVVWALRPEVVSRQ